MDLTPEQIQQMISMLQSMLPSSQKDKETIEEDEDNEFVSTIKTKKVSTKNKKSNFKNKFNSMPEKNMHKEDIAIDKKLHVTEPTPRRKANSLTEAQCRVCGRTETISSSLIIDRTRFKCNNCSAGAG